MAIETLNPDQLRLDTDGSILNISSSNELTPARCCTGQERAVTALKTALAVAGPGYNVMLIGKQGTGRLNCLKSVLNDFITTQDTQENPDTVLLPVRGRPNQYQEIELQQGHAQKLINTCQQVVYATADKDTAQQTKLIQQLRSTYSESLHLDEYIQRLDDLSLLLLVSESNSADYRELQQLVPLLLLAGRQNTIAVVRDSFIDKDSLLGTLTTDADTGRKKINAGTLIQAAGGFLIIDGLRLIEDAQLWRCLRDILKSGLIPLSAISSTSSSHTGDSLPLDGNIKLACRVIVLSDAGVYEQLQNIEGELESLFPVCAEFESEMQRNDVNTLAAAGIISALLKQHHCLPLNKAALLAVLDRAVRLSGSRDHITLSRDSLSRILREASALAAMENEKQVNRNHIEAVIQQAEQRFLTDRRDASKAIVNGETQIELAGGVVGQINGLTMVGSGEAAYLEPARLTATVRAGEGAVVDIEREVHLGGSIHSKGVMILTGLLAARYSRHVPLSMIASLVFEQSYSFVDGDSASAAEMMVILSAITETPVKQNLAITGSIDQRGQILCVGDINRKIEGFYHLCQLYDEPVDAGVVIPKTNLRDLMLDAEVVAAVADGRFTLYSVSTLDDVIEIFTGMDSGAMDNNSQFPEGSFNALVESSLKQFSEEKKHEHKDE